MIVRCSSNGIKSQIVSHLLDPVSKYWWKPRRAFFSISRILIIIPEPKIALTLNLRLEFRQNQKKNWRSGKLLLWRHDDIIYNGIYDIIYDTTFDLLFDFHFWKPLKTIWPWLILSSFYILGIAPKFCFLLLTESEQIS